jgi:SAM-dependent methyltransferase
MVTDKSLFHYGMLYHRILDPLTVPARKLIVEQIPEGSRVLDIGCGTGALCLNLKRSKNCQVVGIDLSQKMLKFAKANIPDEDISFLHLDATDLSEFSDNGFDHAIVMNVIHELNPGSQAKLIKEAYRVAEKVLLYDSNVPLPWNLTGIVKRIIEVTFGLDHYPQFRGFISQGGITGILSSAELSNRVSEIDVHFQGCNLLVTLAS